MKLNLQTKQLQKLGSLPTPILGNSSSSVSLVGPKFPQGTTRIADQTIEEVDEQLTIQSNRVQEKRPTAQSLFATSAERVPARSSPIDVPGSFRNNDHTGYERVQSVVQWEHQPYIFPNNAIFSSSAPEENMVRLPTPQINVNSASNQTSPGSANKEGNKSAWLLTFE